MINILVAFAIGVGMMGVVWAVRSHFNRIDYRVEQEKDWLEVTSKVDEVVTTLERIIRRPRE